MVLCSFLKINLLFRITDPLKHKSPVQLIQATFQLTLAPFPLWFHSLQLQNIIFNHLTVWVYS